MDSTEQAWFPGYICYRKRTGRVYISLGHHSVSSEEYEDMDQEEDKGCILFHQTQLHCLTLTMRICCLQNNLSGHNFKNYSLFSEYFRISLSSLLLAWVWQWWGSWAKILIRVSLPFWARDEYVEVFVFLYRSEQETASSWRKALLFCK